MVYYWQNSVLAYVTMFYPEMSQVDGRGRNFSLSQSTSPCGDKLTCLPIIVLSFEPQALLTGFYPLVLGERGTKKNKSKNKGKRNLKTDSSLTFHIFLG